MPTTYKNSCRTSNTFSQSKIQYHMVSIQNVDCKLIKQLIVFFKPCFLTLINQIRLLDISDLCFLWLDDNI